MESAVTDGRQAAARFSSRLMWNGTLSLLLVALSLTFLPAQLPGPTIWAVVVATSFIAFGLSLYLCFDALLFRLIATAAVEAEGMKDVDAFLARTGLRKADEPIRPVADRIRGTARIVWLQRLALAAFLITRVSM
jgi:hypothetical protein